MKKLNSIIFAFIALALFACKDDETEPDTQAPAIVFSAPFGDAEFHEGEEITIEAEVTDNLALEE